MACFNWALCVAHRGRWGLRATSFPSVCASSHFLAGGTILTSCRNYGQKPAIAQLPVCHLPETLVSGAQSLPTKCSPALIVIQGLTKVPFLYSKSPKPEELWNLGVCVPSRTSCGSSPAASLNFWSHRFFCNKYSHCEPVLKLPVLPVPRVLPWIWPQGWSVTDFAQWGTAAVASCSLFYGRRTKKHKQFNNNPVENILKNNNGLGILLVFHCFVLTTY